MSALILFLLLLQVEFYFSDSNIPTDEFLRGKISESSDASILITYFFILSFFSMEILAVFI